MSMRMRSSVSALVLGTVVVLAGCGTGVRAAFYVPVPPPGPIRETIIVSPGSGYVWVPGYHRWEGGHYLWVSGRWDRAPRARARWESGRWRHSRQGWYWVEGRWR
jgi:hypothetical protein